MFTVDEIYDEARKDIGSCDEKLFFRWVTDAVALIANKADFEGWKGYVDICVSGQCITLPREVQTVVAVNIEGNPAVGRNQLFSFHLNGPGDNKRSSCNWYWDDSGYSYATYRDIVTPSQLVAYLENENDNGSSVIVHGFDEENRPLWHTVGGEQRRGYPLPTVYGYAVPDDAMPKISRITRIVKERTKGSIRVSTTDDSGMTGTLLGVYEPDELVPQYRRIRINRAASWVRVAYMKANPRIDSMYDHIPLQSRTAFLLAVKALRMYKQEDIAEAHSFEADAARLELEAQDKLDVATLAPPCIVDHNQPQDKSDWDIR